MPNAPADVTAVPVPPSSIKLKWTAFSGAGFYNVYRSTSASGNYAKVGTTSGTSYTDNKGLSVDTTYYYKVSANTSKGESDKSAPASATILPDVPISVNAAAVSSSSIRVSWAAFYGATFYYVYRSTSASGTYTRVGTTSAASYTDTGLSENTSYYYKVSANTSKGESGRSDYASARTQAESSGGGHVHDWGDWGTPTSATVTTDGVRTRVCKNDASHTDTEIVEYATGTAGLSFTPYYNNPAAYEVSLGTATGDIFIPAYHRPDASSPYLPVSYLNSFRFHNTSITSITFAEGSITLIGIDAFYNCTSLTSVHIPASVTAINHGAFRNCTSLETVTFAQNSQLTSINSGAQNEGDGTFYNCTSLKSITIPASVTEIGTTYTSSPTSWRGGAFYNCTSLTSVTFEAGSQLTVIPYRAFYNCTSLKSITIPAGVTYIGDGAFSSDYKTDGSGSTMSLQTITFAAGSQLQTIRGNAFAFCISLASITLPASVTEIGSYAFSFCDSLTSITIPASVTAIGSYAFDCLLLASVTFEGAIPSSGFSTTAFHGDLCAKFYATDPANGTPGTYTTTRTGDESDWNTAVWTKQ